MRCESLRVLVCAIALSLLLTPGTHASADGTSISLSSDGVPTSAVAPPAATTANLVAVTVADPATSNPAPNVVSGTATREMVLAELGAIESAKDLSEELRKQCVDRLNKAKEWLDSEAASHKRQLELESFLPTVPGLVVETEAALANFSDAVFQVLPTGNTIVELESQLGALRLQVETDEKSAHAKESEVENRTNRLTELAKEALDLEQRITDAKKSLAAISGEDLGSRAQMLEQLTRLRCREQQLVSNKLERRRIDETAQLLPLQRDLTKRTFNGSKKMLARWQEAIDTWRKEESTRQAVEAKRTAANSHPALKSLAEKNAEIAEQRILTAAGIESLTKTIKEIKKAIVQYDEDFEQLRQKVEHAGATSTTGLLLRKQRNELPGPEVFAKRVQFVETEMPSAHLRSTEWKRLRREVADPVEAANQMLGSLSQIVEKYGVQQVVDVLSKLLHDRRDLLDKAIPDQDTLLQQLHELELANHQHAEQVNELREYLNQRVLWIRSSESFSLDEVSDAMSRMQVLVSPSRWGEVLRVGGGDILRRPAMALAMLAFVVLLIIFRSQLLAAQLRFSTLPEPGTPASFLRYSAAFAVSIVLSARWPALLLAAGYRLKTAAFATDWTQSVGDACITTVLFLWGCELMRELCRRDSVGEKVFAWSTAATDSVRNTLFLTILVGTPMFALLQLSQFGELAEQQSLQRLLFVSILGLLAVQIGWLLRPGGKLMRDLVAEAPTSMVARFRHSIWMSVTGSILAFLVLSLVGYHFSAYQLSGRLAETGAMVIAIIVLYSLTVCWLEVNGYNRELLEPETGDVSHSESVLMETTLADADVEIQPSQSQAVSMHAAADREFRDLLRYASVLLLIGGGWVIWAEVLPALRILDRVVLWQNIETVAETIVDTTTGRESIQINEHTVATTLTDVLSAMLVCLATVLVGRRIPGVLQLTLLERIPMEPGGRQAVAIIVRYVATLAGMLVACHIIRLSWASVQWLAAAMTVGLGFGLQEIFANLVSGLIILFERPIRMGDLVTVGDVTGNVTRMQMRATTITDFDRRELIVPNKKFITDNVINWTLSDPISRVVLPVGVAYGTDVDQVQRILMRIARRNTLVLKDPPPTTLFKGFGESTLDIMLRVFIPKRDIYTDVVNQLNGAIAREFQQAGIQIAFPQRDLHIKSIETLQAILPVKRAG